MIILSYLLVVVWCRIASREATKAPDNAFMFPGISSRHSGTSDAGKGYADGSFNGGGADYAEMFEWNDGNLTKKIE